MIHLSALSEARPEQPTVLTVGAFDGVHLGHQALIRDMSAYARANGMRSAVLTFYPHPSVVLNGRRPSFYIYRPAEKLSVFETLGLDLCLILTKCAQQLKAHGAQLRNCQLFARSALTHTAAQ